MKDKLKGVAIAIAAVAVLAVGAAAIAGATGGADDAADQAISGQALERAKAAALDHTGGGNVTETEAGDGEGAYEVEVTRADGSQVEVQLDKGFNVISQAGDDDKGGENESGGEED